MTTGIVTAGGGQQWETAVVAELDRPGAPLTVVRRCADVADLVAVASTGQASVALISAYLRHFDSETVERLRQLGTRCVVVHRDGDERMPLSLRHIGVALALADSTPVPSMIDQVRRVADGTDDENDGNNENDADGTNAKDASAPVSPADDVSFDDHETGPVLGGWAPTVTSEAPLTVAQLMDADPSGADLPARPRPAEAAVAAGPETDDDSLTFGVIAVWGPGGAPGRSTVAMGLADQLAARGRSVLLIDADVYGGILASAYGLLDESAGLAGACRLAATGRLTAESLIDLCWQVRDGLTVLTGISRADRWPELRPSTIPAVFARASEIADAVVVDLSAVLEVDEEISFDTLAPRRNGATIAAVSAADTVLAIGSGDPAGMQRLVRGYAELDKLVEQTVPAVVLNKVRSAAASQQELSEATTRYFGVEPVAYLPEDRAAVDLAWRRGLALSVAAPKSPLTAALSALADLMPTRARSQAPARTGAHARHA